MTTDRERILEVLRELLETRPDFRVGQILDAASTRSDSGNFIVCIEDSDLLCGMIDFLRQMKAVGEMRDPK